MSTRNTNKAVKGAGSETTALDALRRIHTEWTISADDAGFVAVRSEPDDVIRATLVETLGQRLHAAQHPGRWQMPKGTPTRADEIQKGHIVVMGTGHIRVVTAVEHTREGMVDLRLGTTWHSYEPDHRLDRTERRPQ